MAKRTKQSIIILIYLFSLLFITNCANQLPPGGGEVDKIPPDIISTYPENETINFHDDYIEIEFSEYVDKRTFKDALFISPALNEQPEISWTGTSVEIYFPAGLKDSVTYVVTIGTDVVDVNNKNRMANSFSFSFSTGDKIDRRTISGKVYGKEKEGSLIFAYKIKDDTTKYLIKKPDYISQTGKEGDYRLKGLAESAYRVFAVKDQFRDLLYQADQDWIGLPSGDVSLVGTDSSFNGLDFRLMKVDTLKPRLLSSVMTDRNHIIVSYSEQCDSASYSKSNYKLIDSTSNLVFPVNYSYASKSKKEDFVLGITDSVKSDHIYYLLAEKLTDLTGNIFIHELSPVVASVKADTSAPNLYKTFPDKNSTIDFQNAVIKLYFDDAITGQGIKNAVQFSDTSKNKIEFNLSINDDATVYIKPVGNLKPETSYQVRIDLSKFTDAAGNKRDSVFVLKFQTITGTEFTGLSGKLITEKKNVIVVLQNSKDETKFYTAQPDKTTTYSFVRIEPGTYSVWVFSDTDNSKTFSYGYPDPFRFSEEFKVVTDTLKLRPRWSITDFNIEFK